MGIDRQPGRTIAPLRASSELGKHVGEWVAVKAGKVVAAAASSRELATKLRTMGADAHGATAQYVVPPAEGYKVGVG
jgi:hypothetical protein